MEQVKRFSVGVDGVDPNGNLVRYEDYQALQRKLDAKDSKLPACKAVKEIWKNRAWTAEEALAELNKKLDALSHECGMMMGLLNDICRYHEECTHDDMMHALIPLEYVSVINEFVGRDVNGENPCPLTDKFLNIVRAEVVEDVAKRLYGNGYNFEVLTRFATQLRADATKGGSDD